MITITGYNASHTSNLTKPAIVENKPVWVALFANGGMKISQDAGNTWSLFKAAAGAGINEKIAGSTVIEEEDKLLVTYTNRNDQGATIVPTGSWYQRPYVIHGTSVVKHGFSVRSANGYDFNEHIAAIKLDTGNYLIANTTRYAKIAQLENISSSASNTMSITGAQSGQKFIKSGSNIVFGGYAPSGTPPLHYNVGYSEDDGVSWTLSTGLPNPKTDTGGVLCALPSGNIISIGIRGCELSTDHGKTFSELTSFGASIVDALYTNPVSRYSHYYYADIIPTGELMFMCIINNHSACSIFSSDEGVTWSDPVHIPHKISVSMHDIQLSGTKIIAVCPTDNTPGTAPYIVSEDGRTWEKRTIDTSDIDNIAYARVVYAFPEVE